MSRSVEEAIRQAIQEGKFDNLPGQGKPFCWQENPHADPETALAYHLLQTSGFTLPWIETRREIEADLERARRVLRRAWTWRRSALSEGWSASLVETEWQSAQEAFRQQIAALNRRVASYNLEVPHLAFQRRCLDAEGELRAIIEAL